VGSLRSPAAKVSFMIAVAERPAIVPVVPAAQWDEPAMSRCGFAGPAAASAWGPTKLPDTTRFWNDCDTPNPRI